jgi:two-component system response regulator FixJ
MSCRIVYLIDEDPVSRRALVRDLADLDVEAWTFTPAHFAEMAAALAPSCALFSADMAEVGSLAALKALFERVPGWPVIVVASGGDTALAVQAMKLGAVDYLERPAAREQLEGALAAGAAMLDHMQSADASLRVAQEKIAGLSPRELEVSRALMRGMGNKAVAFELGLSVRTVEMHRARILKKLGVRSMAEGAALIAQAEMAAAPANRVLTRRTSSAAGEQLSLLG